MCIRRSGQHLSNTYRKLSIATFHSISEDLMFILSSLHIFSDETTQVNHSGMITQVTSDGDGYGVWRRPRSESSADAESVYMTNAVLSDSGYAHHSRRSSVSVFDMRTSTSFRLWPKIVKMFSRILTIFHDFSRIFANFYEFLRLCSIFCDFSQFMQIL